MRGFASVLALCGILACGSDDGDGAAANTEVTYHDDVRPLIDAYCIRCHQSDGYAPFSLESEEIVLQVARDVVRSVEVMYMPLDDDCPDIEGSYTMSMEQREVFIAWQKNDFALGDEADYQPLAKRCLTPPAKEP